MGCGTRFQIHSQTRAASTKRRHTATRYMDAAIRHMFVMMHTMYHVWPFVVKHGQDADVAQLLQVVGLGHKLALQLDQFGWRSTEWSGQDELELWPTIKDNGGRILKDCTGPG